MPVRVIVDFDALNDRGVLKGLVEGLGSWDKEMEKDRSIVEAGLRGSQARLTVDAVRSAVQSILGGDNDAEVTSAMITAVRSALEPETGWRAAKKSGEAVVPPGEATNALGRLLRSLKATGVFVVPGGAVESFVREVGGKGPKWVTDVVEGGYLDRAEEAKKFLREIVRSLDEERGGV